VNKEEIRQLFESFNELNALVLGDVMLDAYYFGNVERISPEAPVPVVSVSSKDRRLGGAANVALNLKNLGAQVRVCAVVGNDRDGELLKDLFEKEGIISSGIVTDFHRTTTIKTRIIANDQQVLRVDEEDLGEIRPETEAEILAYIQNHIDSLDVIVLQDYNKGLLSKSLIQKTIRIANKSDIPVVVDPKKENFLNYKNVSLFKPNRKELVEGLKLEGPLKRHEDISNAIIALNEKINAEHIMVTLSEDGTAILKASDISFFPAHPRKIIDVSGAGDSVISVAALCIALSLEAVHIAALSNLAGGLVCEHVGVIPIDKKLFLKEALETVSQ